MKPLADKTRRRLEIQGFENVEENLLRETAPWLRFSFALCTILTALGTILASPFFLWSLIPVSAIAAFPPVHPFDLIYNFGIRYFTGTSPLPPRGTPNRFACGVGTVWLLLTGLAFYAGYITTGYILGALLCVVGILVSTINFCIPSFIYRMIFGFSSKSALHKI